MGDQVYTPATITDEPFPTDNPASFAVSQSNNAANQTYAPATTQDSGMPNPQIAQRLISTKLNTQTKKILGSFQFAPSGAIKIGDFTQGVAGEVDLSPAGILAKNLNGDTTVAIDGDTGDASFMGTLQAGSIIGEDGLFVVEKATNGGVRIVLYIGGLPGIVIGDPS